MKTFLHVGCGPARKDKTTAGFNTDEWKELRLDVDVQAQPDIIGSMTNIPLDEGSVDAVFSSHSIEHLEAHEVPVALQEFKRVLKPDGFVVIICPDLQAVCALVAEDKLLDELYHVPGIGSITALDVIYGHRGAIADGNKYMAHRCGFTRSVLVEVLKSIGFVSTISARRFQYLDLFVVASPTKMNDDKLTALARSHL